jgi:UDP-N-acetylglucosamine--N-acetylmuramyl-(pentapeptide) pyrophosphoryl-undecaprenol N-acetylglucosamine transferase
MRIVVATGGTGGHIFPALALLEEIKRKKYHSLVVADYRFNNFKKSIPQDTNVKIVQSGGFSGSIIKRTTALLKILFGTIQTVLIFKKYKPNIVVSFGGYPSIPSMLAAKIMKIPLLIHESNSVVGQANKLFLNSACAVAYSFKNTKYITKEHNSYLTGNPVRSSIIKMRKKSYPAISANSKIKILIIGGSQGARILSNILPLAFSRLDDKLRKRLEITQQARLDDIKSVTHIYKEHSINSKVDSFFVDIDKKLQESHIIICRAGATTIAEITAIGRPAILVPIASSKENHQVLNAEWLVKNKAGWMINEKDFSVDNCVKTFEKILKDYKKIESFAQQARGLFLDSSNILLRLVEKYCTNPK